MKNSDVFVSGADFDSYVAVQRSGVTNMWDVARVVDLSGLTWDQVFTIMKNYTRFEEDFGSALASDNPDSYVKKLGV